MRRIILLLGSYERGISNDHIGRLLTDYNDGDVGVDVGHHTVFCDEHLFPDHNDIGGLALPPTRLGITIHDSCPIRFELLQ